MESCRNPTGKSDRAPSSGKPRLDARLDELGAEFGGQFDIESVRPVGLASLELTGVTFWPNESAGVPVLELGTVRVTPRWRSLVRGEVWPREVIIEDPRVVLLVDSDGGGHIPWLNEMADNVRAWLASRDDSEETTASRPMPEVHVVGGYLAVEDPAGRYPSMGVQVERIEMIPETPTRLMRQGVVDESLGAVVEGHVNLEGLGRAMLTGRVGGIEEPELSLRMLQDNDFFAVLPADWTPSAEASLSVGEISLHWPPRITVAPVAAERMNLRLPGLEEWRLDDVWVHSFDLAVDQYGYHLDFDRADVAFGGLLSSLEISATGGRVFRSWDGEMSFCDVRVLDPSGEELAIRLDRVSSTSVTTLRMDAELFDLSTMMQLIPRSAPIQLYSGVLSGELLVEWLPGQSDISGFVFATLLDVDANAPVLSHLPLTEMTLGLDSRFEYSFDTSSFAMTDTTLLVGQMPMSFETHVDRRDESMAMDLTISLAPMDAQRVLDSLPRGLVPVLRDFELGGEFGFEARFEIDTADLDEMVADVSFNTETLEVLEYGALAPIPMFGGEEFSWTLETFEGHALEISPESDEWTELYDPPHHMYRSILAAEDDGFWRHDGFEWRSIRRALARNIEQGRLAQGGSTISQQVVKNLFLSHDRTFGRKLQELFLTWRLEEELEKRRILEIYLNIAHWGPGVYGIHDATTTYFNHTPDLVTVREAVFLASILPNPALFGEQYARNIIAPSRRQKMANILRNLHRRGYITDLALNRHLYNIDRGRISVSPPPDEFETTPVADAEDVEAAPNEYGTLLLTP